MFKYLLVLCWVEVMGKMPVFPKTLGHAIRDAMCGLIRGEESCKCSDPQPITYYCIYGDCITYRCRNCHRVISRVPGR